MPPLGQLEIHLRVFGCRQPKRTLATLAEKECIGGCSQSGRESCWTLLQRNRDLEALGDLIVGTNGHSIQCESIQKKTSLCMSPVKTEFLGLIYWSNLSHMPSLGGGKAEHFE